MELFDKLVIPHSSANLELLKYLLSLALIIFSVFSGALLGSTILSLFFNNKAIKTGKPQFYKLSFDYLNLINGNLMMSLGLGFLPFFSIILIYLQLFHQTGTMITGNLIISLLLFLISIIMLYIHRLQVIIQKKDMEAGATDLDPLYFGMPGLLCLIASLWIFTGSVSLTFDVKQWQTEDSLLYSIISYQSIIRFIHFIVTSMSLAGIAFIVKYFYWDKQENINNEYEEYSKKFNTWLALTFTGLQPVFFICIMFFTPFNALSMFSFTMLLLAIALVFILIHFLYAAIKDGHFQVSSYSLYLMIIIFAVIIIKEQSSYDYASKDQIMKLASNYDKAEAELAANFEKQPEINGKEIYEVKCMACHRFDVKLVGPPHKVVMEKYINNKEGMVQFILNPAKVNPDYPAMPSQGLTPKEVKAVVDYMWKEFGDKVGK